MGVLGRVIEALWPAPNPRAELWAALSESERIEDAGRSLDRIDNHCRAYRRLLMCEAGFDPDEFPFDPHGVKPAVHPIDAQYQGGHRLVVEPIPVASVAAGEGAGVESGPPTTPTPAPNTVTPIDLKNAAKIVDIFSGHPKHPPWASSDMRDLAERLRSAIPTP